MGSETRPAPSEAPERGDPTGPGRRKACLSGAGSRPGPAPHSARVGDTHACVGWGCERVHGRSPRRGDNAAEPLRAGFRRPADRSGWGKQGQCGSSGERGPGTERQARRRLRLPPRPPRTVPEPSGSAPPPLCSGLNCAPSFTHASPDPRTPESDLVWNQGCCGRVRLRRGRWGGSEPGVTAMHRACAGTRTEHHVEGQVATDPPRTEARNGPALAAPEDPTQPRPGLGPPAKGVRGGA